MSLKYSYVSTFILNVLLSSEPVDSVDALGSVAARIAVALVDVDLTVRPRSAWATAALVAVDEVLAMSAVLARVAGTLVHLRLAQVACVAGVALASERVLSVNTVSMMARRGLAVVDVRLTTQSCATIQR